MRPRVKRKLCQPRPRRLPQAVLGPLFAVALLLLSRTRQALGQPLNQLEGLSNNHFTQHGSNLPTLGFTSALRSASADLSNLGCDRALVFLAMANEEALRETVPVFLASLARVKLEVGVHAGQQLDSKLVLVVWSAAALEACRALQGRPLGYQHQCVHDAEHETSSGTVGFRSNDFNALGFPKSKYILNGLSTGYDVVFMDTDIVVLRDPLPHLLSRQANIIALMEKCILYDDRLAFNSREFKDTHVQLPQANIGLLYFKASAAVVRCVYSWVWSMHVTAADDPMLWDQNAFRDTMRVCVAVHRLRWQGLDPRLFQSGCFPQCGCTFADGDVTPATTAKGGQWLPYREAASRSCGPESWNATVSVAAVLARTAAKFMDHDVETSIRNAMNDGSARVGPAPAKDWVLRHFACTGDTSSKAAHMGALLEAFHSNGMAQIKWLAPEPSPGPGVGEGGVEGLAPGGVAGGDGGVQQDLQHHLQHLQQQQQHHYQQQQEAPYEEQRHRLAHQRFRHRRDRKLRQGRKL